MARKKKKRCREVYVATGWNPSGEGRVSMRIPKKDVGFFKVRGYKVKKKKICK